MSLPELKVVPAGKVETNFAEIKELVEKRVAYYDGLVYTDDQISEAKKDRTELNALSKALNRARIDSKKIYMQGFKDFEDAAKKLTKLVDEASDGIGAQITAFEEKQRAEKMEAIQALFDEKQFPEGVIFAHIFDQRWLNKKPELRDISVLMDERKRQIMNDLTTLNSFKEYQGESLSVYFQKLDLNAAMRRHEELVQRDREEEIRRQQEELQRQREEFQRQQEEMRRQKEAMEQQKADAHMQNAPVQISSIAHAPAPFAPDTPIVDMDVFHDELPVPAEDDISDALLDAVLNEIENDGQRYIIRATLDFYQASEVKAMLNNMGVNYEMEVSE